MHTEMPIAKRNDLLGEAVPGRFRHVGSLPGRNLALDALPDSQEGYASQGRLDSAPPSQENLGTVPRHEDSREASEGHD
jgi:hypothetical protein